MRTSMSEVAYDVEQAARFVDHLEPFEYNTKVKKHLELIEAGAEMTARHARAIDRQPCFQTRARSELDQTEATLERALAHVRAAKATYDRKPQEIR